MYGTNSGFRRRVVGRGSGRRRGRFIPQFERLEQRCLCAASQDVFFLHQSVGQGIMEDHGGHPGLVSQIEAAGHRFGDHDLRTSPGGSSPTQIASLFADEDGNGHYGDALADIAGASEADVLMLKSCFYTLAELEDPAALTQRQQAFIDHVAPYANQHPDQKLLLMPAVPERKNSGLSAAAAARGRNWSEWLAGSLISDYTTQHNVFSFNLFDFLADSETHPTNANYQREEYRNSDINDSHPNNAAYSAAADEIVEYLQSVVIGDGDPATGWAGKIIVGAHVGGQQVDGEMSRQGLLAEDQALEQITGRHIALVNLEVPWHLDTWPTQALVDLVTYDAVPLFNFKPWPAWGENNPAFSLDSVIAGQQDAYLDQVAQRLIQYARPVMISFACEMNGDWFPWAGVNNGGGTLDGYGDPTKPDGPERYVDAYADCDRARGNRLRRRPADLRNRGCFGPRHRGPSCQRGHVHALGRMARRRSVHVSGLRRPSLLEHGDD
jgi:hypothetical protein